MKPFLVTVAAAALCSTSALAQNSLGTDETSINLTALDENAVMLAMQEQGFLATMEVANDGTPKISSKVSSTNFSIYFYGCDGANTNCTSISFSAGYDLIDGITATKANKWNRENRFSKTYIDDEDDPYLEMDVTLDFGGVAVENFHDWLDIWRVAVEEFEEFIDW